MSTVEQFRADLSTGESETVEFLADPSSAHFVQTICAFSNTRGGVIYVGVQEPPSGEESDTSVEMKVAGIQMRRVQRIAKQLENHFDDPLPTLRLDELAHRGSKAAVVAVHVARHDGQDDIAFVDRTIWRKKGKHNKSYTARARVKTGKGS